MTGGASTTGPAAASAVEGVLSVLVTPFDPSGRVDVASLRRLVDHQVGAGVDGIVCFGLAGEGYTLTDQERDLVLREAVAGAGGAVPVIASVEHNSTVAALARAEQALGAGAGGLMAYPPTFVPAGPDDIVDYYSRLRQLRSAVVVQDAPAWTRTTLPVDLIERIDQEAGGVAVKVEVMPSAPKIRELRARAIPAVGGYGALHVAEEIGAGITALMPGCAQAAELGALWRAHADGFPDRVFEMWRGLLPVLAFQMQDLGVFVACQKLLLQRSGVITHLTTRAPSPGLTAEQAAWFTHVHERSSNAERR